MEVVSNGFLQFRPFDVSILLFTSSNGVYSVVSDARTAIYSGNTEATTAEPTRSRTAVDRPAPARSGRIPRSAEVTGEMYEDCLLATDGSDGARRATEHAIELADRLGATLHVVSVSEEGPHSSEKRDRMRADPESEAATAVEEAAAAARERNLEVTTTVLEGVPQEEIVAFAEENPIDFLVLGTVGRSGLDKLVVGSVAEQVVESAPAPVVTVRERE